MTSGSNWRHLNRPATEDARTISAQLIKALLQSCNTSRKSEAGNGMPVVECKLFKNNHLKVGISARGGDLNPILGFCFPLCSMVFPYGISIRVETCGSGRKQKCGLLWSIYVQIFYVF